MRHSFSIYFYLKRRKLQKDSKSTIMLRIIVNNKAADVSLKTSILQEHWDKQNRRVSDMNPEAHDINTYLDKVSSTLQHHYRQAQLEGKHLTASMLKQRFMATGSNPPSLLEIFDKQVKDADRLAHAGQISMSHSNRHKLNLPDKEGGKSETIPEQAGNNKDNEQAAGYSQAGFHP